MGWQLLGWNSQRTQERKTSKRNRDSKRSLYTLHVTLKYSRKHIFMEDIPQLRSTRQQHQAGINSWSFSRERSQHYIHKSRGSSSIAKRTSDCLENCTSISILSGYLVREKGTIMVDVHKRLAVTADRSSGAAFAWAIITPCMMAKAMAAPINI